MTSVFQAFEEAQKQDFLPPKHAVVANFEVSATGVWNNLQKQLTVDEQDYVEPKVSSLISKNSNLRKELVALRRILDDYQVAFSVQRVTANKILQ